jgi:glycosyltransferase involved in cell wall biosynthesis
LLIVDDGSTELAVKDVLNLFRDNPKVNITSLEKNQGVAAALNTGLQLALSFEDV